MIMTIDKQPMISYSCLIPLYVAPGVANEGLCVVTVSTGARCSSGRRVSSSRQ